MATPDVEFMTKECRAVTKFPFLKGKTAKEIYDDMSLTLGEKSPCHSTVKNWVARFKTGHFRTEDGDRAGRPLAVTVPENVNTVHSMIVADRRISATKIAETLEISLEHVGFIVHDMLDMIKLSVKWVPKYLTADQKRDCFADSQAALEHFRRNTAGFLLGLWHWMKHGYRYKRPIQGAKRSGSPRPKNFEHRSQPPGWW